MVDANAEIGGSVRYPEIDAAPVIVSSGEIVDDKIFVAVGKEFKESKSTLIWALHNSKGKKICIIYVHVPAKMIPMPTTKVGEKQLKDFRDKEQQEMLSILDTYLKICAQARAEKMHIEMDSTIEEGIVELISRKRIQKLVMGAAEDRSYSRKMVEPKSKKADFVRHHAPDHCHIWFVCKGYLIYTREGVKPPSMHMDQPPDNNQSDAGSPSHDLVSRLRLSNFDEHERSSGEFDKSSRASFLHSPVHSLVAESVFTSPRRSFVNGGDATERGPELLALPESQDNTQGSAPPVVMESTSTINGHLYDQLQQAMIDSENARREAFEESMRRRKAEREALEANYKAKTSERLYYEQLRLREATVEELAKGKEELENTKNLWIKVSHELHETVDQKCTLESVIEESNLSVKKLEEELSSAVQLLEKYKNERNEFQIERDNALRGAEKLTEQLGQGPSNSHVPMYFSEFSFSDVQMATNFLDSSLKIGEGGYGSIYKGLLRHTEVAIKIRNPGSLQGRREFDQEVDVLSKLRHPNLVTLMGACPESCALVYEYLSGGSLEDRLDCKDNAQSLPWQTRIRIVTELCSALIFLHSNRPSCIIHGDLKPANVLLDDNFVCKLSDFGISHVVLNGKTSIEQTALFFTTEPKGTFSYMDPEFLSTGELTHKSDVYSFGIILLRLLTGKSALGISREVEHALANSTLNGILDPSAGDWPFIQAEQLARMALRCCDMNRKNRPDLTSEEIMEDPHIAADGFTYEAEAIRGWLDSGHYTSPMTNVVLANHNLTPNRALRSAIQEWLQQHCTM